MLNTQAFVASMCESIESMKLTDRQREMAKAVMRTAIDYANAKHGMHASQGARTAATADLTPAVSPGEQP